MKQNKIIKSRYIQEDRNNQHQLAIYQIDANTGKFSAITTNVADNVDDFEPDWAVFSKDITSSPQLIHWKVNNQISVVGEVQVGLRSFTVYKISGQLLDSMKLGTAKDTTEYRESNKF